MGTPLLTTKLFIPVQRSNLVNRLRLSVELDEACQDHRIILVSAKAGSGKTTLVSEWLQQQDRPAAWLSLDVNDNDPQRFFSYLFLALQSLQLQISPSLMSQMEASELPQIEAFVGQLINDLASAGTAFHLVLDDFHLIHHEWIHQALSYLVEHLPPNQQMIIIITRADPPLPLTRLRGRGQIAEIRDQDLRFSAQEAAQFFNDVMHLGLTQDAIAKLEGRTEGWITGLQMAAISMRGLDQSGDRTSFIETFGGTNRYILDYLMDEVMSRQSKSMRNFLLETSILERMCAPLCASLTEFPDSQTILSQLEQENLFVVALDNERRWYRYHHLFADLLRSSLHEQYSAAKIDDLHRRAGLWHHQQGNLEEAMIHAMAGKDYTHAAQMIDENIASMLSRSEAPVLLGWIEKLPREIALNRPWVDIYRGYTLALSGRSDEADQVLSEVEERINPADPRYSELIGQIAAIRCFSASLQGDAAQVLKMAALAEEHLPQEHLNARGITAYALADVYFANDDLDNAFHASSQMLEVGEKLDRLLMAVPALCDLAGIKKAQGRLHMAESYYERAKEWMTRRSGLDSRVRCPYEIGLADLAREWNQLDLAQEHALTGIHYCRRFAVPSLLISGYIALMRVQQARGDLDGALDALHNAENSMQGLRIRLTTRIEINTVRVLFWLAAGDLRAAQRWAAACAGGSEQEQIVKARLLLAQGRPDAAQEILDRQHELAKSGRRSGRLIEILSLLALTLQKQEKVEAAGEALAQAFSLAGPEGYCRLFLDLGRPLQELLQRMQQPLIPPQPPGSTGLIGEYERAILAAFQQESRSRPEPQTEKAAVNDFSVEGLTERELEVLQLLAQGFTNKEIAAQLIVAPSTIKQHLKNIYSKLDVHSRIQAVEYARLHNLLNSSTP